MPVGVIGGDYFANFVTAFQFEHGQLSAVFVTLLGFGIGGRSLPGELLLILAYWPG